MVGTQRRKTPNAVELHDQSWSYIIHFDSILVVDMVNPSIIGLVVKAKVEGAPYSFGTYLGELPVLRRQGDEVEKKIHHILESMGLKARVVSNWRDEMRMGWYYSKEQGGNIYI